MLSQKSNYENHSKLFGRCLQAKSTLVRFSEIFSYCAIEADPYCISMSVIIKLGQIDSNRMNNNERSCFLGQ